jgi:hypothetical protein
MALRQRVGTIKKLCFNTFIDVQINNLLRYFVSLKNLQGFENLEGF